VRRSGVPGRSGVDDGDAPTGSAEDESRAEAGGPAADDHDVVRGCLRVVQLGVIVFAELAPPPPA